MNILLVHNFYRTGSPGGEDVVVRAEQRLLERAGHQVVTYFRSNDEMDEGSWTDRWRVAASLKSRNPHVRKEIQDILRRESIDIVHIHNTFPLIGVAALDACREMGIKVVQTVHNQRFSCAAGTHFRAGAVCDSCTASRPWRAITHRCYRDSSLASWLVADFIRREYRRRCRGVLADRYLALTEFTAQRLAATGVPAARIAVRPNFIEIPGDASRGVSQGRTPVGPSHSAEPYAIFTGRVSGEKGLDTLLKAWSHVGDIPLKIIGDGPLRAALEQRCRDSALPIKFLGALGREDALSWVRQARLQVVPSVCFEGMPLVILEAWALGVPVLASRLGSLAEMMGDHEYGETFSPGDPMDLAQRLVALWQNPQRLAQLAQQGTTRYEAEHSPERGLESLLGVYHSTLGVPAI